jgi:hypothetical protein
VDLDGALRRYKIDLLMVGRRYAEFARYFIQDLAHRIQHRIQLSTDGHKVYLNAVEQAFGSDIDYAMLVKLYGPAQGSSQTERRYSQGACLGAICQAT